MKNPVAMCTLCTAMLTTWIAGPANAAELTAEVRFAREVENREPLSPGQSFSPGKLYCWNLLKGGEGEYAIQHVWYRDGKQVWRRSVRARGAKWVTWSYFNVTPGSWKVELQDSEGKVIQTGDFTVKQ
jgi:hypothetical protein